MNFMIFVPVITALVFCPSVAKSGITGRIFNGYDANSGQFKYMAAVVTYVYTTPKLKKGTCGGAIIGQNWVLTAAHCVDKAEKAEIYLGALDRHEAEIEYEVQKEDIFLHPEWTRPLPQNDIALIQIPTTKECDSIAFARLPFRWLYYPVDKFAGMMAIAMGWGKMGNSGPLPSRLQWALMKIISNNECNEFFGDIIETDLCVDTSAPYGSTCMGDSGGPLVFKNTAELVGITSSIPDDSCELGDPVVFTRVSSYLPWITGVSGIVS